MVNHAAVLRMVHDASLDRLQVIICFRFNTRGDHESEEYVQPHLEGPLSHFDQSLIVSLQNSKCLLSDCLTVRTLPTIKAFYIFNHFTEHVLFKIVSLQFTGSTSGCSTADHLGFLTKKRLLLWLISKLLVWRPRVEFEVGLDDRRVIFDLSSVRCRSRSRMRQEILFLLRTQELVAIFALSLIFWGRNCWDFLVTPHTLQVRVVLLVFAFIDGFNAGATHLCSLKVNISEKLTSLQIDKLRHVLM